MPTVSLPAPNPAPVPAPVSDDNIWIMGDPHASCDAACSSHGWTCNAQALTDLKGQSLSVFDDKFALAGMDCTETFEHCVLDNNCVRWASPYVHKDHFTTRKCQAGSSPSVASCGDVPVDHNHRRLCPCE